MFLNIVHKLNDTGIQPIIYGSMGLRLLLNKDIQINDIDFIIESPDQFEVCKQVMLDMGFQLDPDHHREFMKDELYCSFIDKGDIENLISEPLVCKKVAIGKCLFFNISIEQYKKIYEKGLGNVYRRKKREEEDLEKIKLIENFMKTIFYHGLGESKNNYKSLSKNITIADIDWNKVKATSAKGYDNVVSFSLGVVFALNESSKRKVNNLILCSPTPFETLEGVKAKNIYIIVGEKEEFLLNIFRPLIKDNVEVIVLKGAGHRFNRSYKKIVVSLLK